MDMSCKTFEEAMAILDDALTFGIDPSLDGMFAMMEALGNPQKSFKSIQIAGTNGKTSTSRMAAALLRAYGYKVGLYTSPDLVTYPERYEIDGKVISDELFVQGIDKASQVAEAVVASGLAPAVTEFELLTAAAMQIFAEEGVDYAVLECGMGGRWDATTVVDPEVAVITGIGLDHTAILGDTLELISGEKAAIIEPGCIAVVGDGVLQPEVLPVFVKQAEECGTPLHMVYEVDEENKDEAPLVVIADTSDLPLADLADKIHPEMTCHFQVLQDDEEGIRFSIVSPRADYGSFFFDQPRYQASNVSTALLAVEEALGKELDAKIIQQVLDTIVFPGRFETLREDPLLIIDAAHNPQGAHLLAQTICRHFPEYGLPTLLLAVLADKDARGVIEELAPAASRIVVTRTTSPRAHTVEELAAMVTELTGVEPETFATPEEAVEALTQRGEKVVASGSITLAGAVKALFI